MKKALITLAIAITGITQAQTAIGFQATQNVTLQGYDLTFKALLQGNDSDLGYLVVAPNFHVSDNHKRYGVDVGYAFHTYILGIDIMPSIGSGAMFTTAFKPSNIEFSTSVKIPISGGLSGVILGGYMAETYKVGVGIRYDISTEWKSGSRF